jgi:hypothetical protein
MKNMLQFDDSQLIGLTVAAADALLQQHGGYVREVANEGGDFTITNDCHPKRCNVATENHIIARIVDWG